MVNSEKSTWFERGFCTLIPGMSIAFDVGATWVVGMRYNRGVAHKEYSNSVL